MYVQFMLSCRLIWDWSCPGYAAAQLKALEDKILSLERFKTSECSESALADFASADKSLGNNV